MKFRPARLTVAISLCVISSQALSSPQVFSSARNFAMGGTGVASSMPSAAAAKNPALMAADHHDWADDFGISLSVGARVADGEDVQGQAEDIQDSIDDFEQIADQIDGLNTSGATPSEVEAARDEARSTATRLKGELIDLDEDTTRADVGVELSFALPSPRFSVGGFATVSARVVAKGDLSDSDISLLDDIIDAGNNPEDFANGTAPNQIDNLTSEGRVLASGIGELGIAFAHQYKLADNRSLEVGVSPKFVQLVTYQYTQAVNDFDEDSYDSDDFQTEKSGFNLDVGANYTFGADRQWNAGVVVKNLIPMELDSAAARPGEEKYTLEIDPMVTAGIAHRGNFHVVTADLELTKRKAFGYGDDTQWLAVGGEFDAWRWAQLRVGARFNLASNGDDTGIDESSQFTAGIGLSPFGARFDIAGMVSDNDVGAMAELGYAF